MKTGGTVLPITLEKLSIVSNILLSLDDIWVTCLDPQSAMIFRASITVIKLVLLQLLILLGVNFFLTIPSLDNQLYEIYML